MIASLKKNIKTIFFTIIAIALFGTFVAYKLWTKPHRNIEKSEAISISAIDLGNFFENDENLSNKKYLDKILLISGTVGSMEKNQEGNEIVVFKSTDLTTVRCTLEATEHQKIISNSVIKIKGICTGYLTDVIMVRCSIEN